MSLKEFLQRRLAARLPGLGMFLLALRGILAIMMTSASAYWVWSLTLAINDLKFYPDQIFPELTYPVDYEVVRFPDPVNDFSIQVPSGAEITFVNKDRNPGDEAEKMTIIAHLIQVLDEEQILVERSPLLQHWGQSYTARFDRPGEFNYRCLLHPQKMRGRIKVIPWGLELVHRI